nr:cysteine peptidase family C39 domain-containing protein [uncultured Holophaga sp.]
MAHRALGELLEVNAGLGQRQALEQWVKVAEAQSLGGLLTEKLSLAKESLGYMQNSPETAYRCGPTALAYLKATEDPKAFADSRIQHFLSSEQGTSLAKNAGWAEQLGLKVQMAKRWAGGEFPVPSLLHFRSGHFAAAMYARNGRVLVQDPALGDTWVPRSILEQESTGYALIPAGALPKGWTAVSKAEGEKVWGKGAWGPGRPDDTRPDSRRFGTQLLSSSPGGVRVSYLANLVDLNVEIPVVDYAPAKGPRIDLSVTYNHREYGQPETFDYCNLGSKWTFTFLTCLKDDTTNPDFNVTLCNPGGGGLIFQSRGDGTYLPEGYTQAQLVRQPNNTYTIEYLDGHKDFYEAADRGWGLRRIILTRRQDQKGLEAKFGWDAMLRLVSITDADGQVTRLSYENAADPLKLTQVVDPRGRTTRFEYDEQGRLVRTVDSEGRASNFSYGLDSKRPGVGLDFINHIETPAGSLSIRAGEGLVGPSYRRWLEAERGDGTLERLEGGAGYAYEIDPEQFPKAPELDTETQHPLSVSARESFFWGAGAYRGGQPDYSAAHHIRWGHGPGGYSSGIVLSEKAPGEARHWYIHAGDFWGGVFPGAHTDRYPLTPEGLSRMAPKGAAASALLPVCDGNRNLVTRDYWVRSDGSLGVKTQQFDAKGQAVVVPSLAVSR